jgi:hypothetical protein
MDGKIEICSQLKEKFKHTNLVYRRYFRLPQLFSRPAFPVSWWRHRVQLVCISSVTSSPFCPNILLSNLFSNTLSLCFLSLRSFIQGIRPGPRFLATFRNKFIFYGEELLVPCQTPKLEDHTLSAVRDFLFNIFAATLYIWRPSPPSANWGRAMPWWQAIHLTWKAYGGVDI